MDGHDHPKLTRTQSSLLRSSPTVRSSIQSLPSITIDDDNRDRYKRSHKPDNKTVLTYCLAVGSSITLFFLTFIYLSNNKTLSTTSEKLLFILVFIAVAIFYLGKNKRLKQLIKLPDPNLTRKNTNTLPVEWFIGDRDTVYDKPHNKKEVLLELERVECYNNGDYYEGEFYGGKSNGCGVYNYSVNGRYEGEWIEGKYDGYGIESWARGSRYKGQYKCGTRHGFGVYRFYTGDTFGGEWFNGYYHGIGIQTCSDGSSFVGMFKFGVKHCLGSYRFRNGDRYAGEYFGDKIHGFGVYHFANGHCYEGSWHEGRKQGYGMYTFRNGEAKCGEWNCGSLKTPLPPLTDSVLRAVQSARKAAENAINLQRVDEQVNKAVIGANRAATAARVAAIKAVQNRMTGKFYDTDA